jgi:TolB protein
MKRNQYLTLPQLWIYLLLYITTFFTFLSIPAGVSAQLNQNEVYLQIKAGAGTNLIGVGIEGFSAPDASAPVNAVRETLIDDLNYSGLFQVKTLSDTLSAVRGGIFQQWKASGASCYLVGETAGIGNSVSVKLYDLNTGLTRLDAEYRIDRDRPWYTAHVIVDDMIQLYNGLRGSFASQIAYLQRFRSGNDSYKEIFITDADGRKRNQLTFSRADILSTSWSSAIDRIAYSTFAEGKWAIASINVNTGQSQSISSLGSQSISPSWCPTTPDLLAFSSNRDGNNEIYLMRSSGSGLRRLTNSPGIDVSPSWSPDGSRIAFVSDRTGSPAIYIMGNDGSGQRRLTSIPNTYEDSPNWSPRGDRIVFVIRTGPTGADIAISSPDGNDVLMLTMGEGTNENPKWSPDGLRIVFSSTRLGGQNLFIMNWDGTGIRPLTKEGNCLSPSWAPSVSGDDIRVSKR